MISERLGTAATRGAIVALTMFLFGIWRGRITVEMPPSKRTIIYAVVLLIAWAMLTIWQVRSRVERWPWMSVLVGYITCLFVLALVTFAVVRLGLRL